jgi:hypothetical protein
VPESTLEHVSLAVIEWLGFDPPELQKWVFGPHAGDGDRLDFWWEEVRVGGEADGDVKYSGTDAVAVLRARRDRDARLIDRGVAATAHWGWHDVIQGAPLRAALLAVGLRPSRPEEPAQLRSLTRLLRPTSRALSASLTARQHWSAETAPREVQSRRSDAVSREERSTGQAKASIGGQAQTRLRSP